MDGKIDADNEFIVLKLNNKEAVAVQNGLYNWQKERENFAKKQFEVNDPIGARVLFEWSKEIGKLRVRVDELITNARKKLKITKTLE